MEFSETESTPSPPQWSILGVHYMCVGVCRAEVEGGDLTTRRILIRMVT